MKAQATMKVIYLIFIIFLMVAFALFVQTLNFQPEMKRILWFVEALFIVLFFFGIVYL